MKRAQKIITVKQFNLSLAILLGLVIFYINGGSELNIFAKGYLITFELKLTFLLALGLAVIFKFKRRKS
jgi:hypothetical protein